MFHSSIFNANEDYLHWIWTGYPCHTLLDNIHVFHDRNKPLHIIAVEEPYLYGPSKFSYEEIRNSWGNSKTDVILGYYPIEDTEFNWIKNNDTLEVLKPTRHYFSLFFLFYAFTRSTHFAESNPDPIPKIKPNSIWSYYCRAARTHRYLFLELAAEANLLSTNIYTYNKSFETKSPIAKLKQQFNYDGGNFDYKHRLYLKDKASGGSWASENSADGAFCDSVFHIAGETMHEVCFWTEKTFVPLMLGKPVLVQGSKESNLRLRDFGFKLYDNVVDYSFDQESDIVVRNRKLVQQLKLLEDRYSPEELYRKIKDIAEYNKRVALDIIINKKYIPSIYFEWVDIYKDNAPAYRGPLDWYRLCNTRIEQYVKNNQT